eukprot:NODE_2492_length_1163_cov_24.308880_g2375_i0.p1 GENE.NODE_2492_length_1163_cov_24.308880_g2375_i0~~NODE_2492_length_1163_cov_24.308880_g2375_i0.p1  ORF type:complete len:352 (+),score=71.35 NODE_2492_length_1163_cov_24.308880_g2375_i0:56-1057(+)
MRVIVNFSDQSGQYRFDTPLPLTVSEILAKLSCFTYTEAWVLHQGTYTCLTSNSQLSPSVTLLLYTPNPPVNVDLESAPLIPKRPGFNHQFLVSFIYFLCCSYVMGLIQVLVQGWGGGANKDVLLPDLGFTLLPYVPGPTATTSWADVWVLTVIAATILRFLVVSRSLKLTVLRRFVCVYGTLILLRSLCISLTLLPNPYRVKTVTLSHSVWVEAALVVTLQVQTTADLFFSGHSVDVSMCVWMWWHYGHLPIRAVSNPHPTLHKCVACSFAGAGYVLILCCRMHYTIDVLTGAVVTFALWQYYTHQLRQLSEGGVWGLIKWLEARAEDIPHP